MLTLKAPYLVFLGATTNPLDAKTGRGRIAEDWLGVLKQSIDAGLDIVSGMHTRLSSVEVLRKGAEAAGVRLIDVRVPPADIPIGTGNRRSGKRLLTVSTDCCVGKKYTALAIQAELAKREIAATFRASGQTGIMIAGEGIPIDALVSDFISGAAEQLGLPVVDPLQTGVGDIVDRIIPEQE